ncbi:hypothetical protein PRZ48_004327 [Zasmidium cellare]|uniref:Uncharacterized protein n=1 Tax=Zasmidium cellare TaxID=395010 RepID=A0ABR0EPH3_ZASCE|nr:hypothetical protein PRZ48_004327 [Zasmidium cellare]
MPPHRDRPPPGSLPDEIDLPPSDSYDKYQHLVPPHFSPTPDLVNIYKAYSNYGNHVQKTKWRPVSMEAKNLAQRIYRKYSLNYNLRYRTGLYIAGSETDLEDQSRDRMMVLVFELNGSELHRWKDIHFDAMDLLARLGLSGEHGVCVRYYRRWERVFPRPAQYTSTRTDEVDIDMRPGETIDSWVQRRSEAVEQARIMRRRADREYVERLQGNHESPEHAPSLMEAARALTSLMRYEEVPTSERPPPPYGELADLPSYSAERSMTVSHYEHAPGSYVAAISGEEVLGNVHTLVDYYNVYANPARRAGQSQLQPLSEEQAQALLHPQPDPYEPDSGTELSGQSVAGSDKEEEPPLRRELPPPAIEFR